MREKIIAGIFISFCLGVFFLNFSEASAAAWYNTSWGYRKTITIDHTKVSNTDQAYFPVLVNITDTDIQSAAKTNGDDIVFTASDGTTLLKYEIEKYDSTTGKLQAWVRLPTLSHTVDTVFYLYYGNSSATSQQDAAATWNDGGSNNFLSVYHLGNGATLSGTDSRGAYNLTNNNVNATTGQVDGGALVGTTNSYLYNNAFTTASTALTFSGWGKQTANDDNIHTIADLGWQYATLSISKYNVRLDIAGFGSGTCIVSYASAYNNWHLYTATFDQTALAWNIYVDGTSIGGCSVTGTASFPGKTVLTVGAISKGDGGNIFGGVLDEVELSKVARSADWIKTQYNNQSTPSTFYSISAQEAKETAPIIDSFTASPATIGAGGSATLSWSILGTVTAVSISPISMDSTDNTGSVSVSPSIDTGYTLSATNAAGTTTATVTVAVDTTPPTIPATPTTVTTTPTSIALSWGVSTDTVGVTGYKIYRNDVLVATIKPHTYVDTAINSNLYDYFVDTGLNSATTYAYAIEAFDGQGNISSKSGVLNASTADVPVVTSSQWNLAYYVPDYSGSVPIYWDGLTHISQVGAVPLSDGSLDTTTLHLDTTAADLVAQAHAHNVKALLVIYYGNGDFSDAVTNHRTTLVSNIVNLVNTYGYDGIDIDWENSVKNFSNLNAFLADLRTALGTKLITADASVGEHTNWGTASTYLDRLNIMTYDFVNSDDPFMWSDSAIYGISQEVWSLELAKNRFVTSGVPVGKINIGIPFFARISEGGCMDVGCTDGLYAPLQTWNTGSNWIDGELVNIYGDYDFSTSNTDWHWDINAHKPYLSINATGSNNDKFVSFENQQSVKDKIYYVQTSGVGGSVVWRIGADYVAGGGTVNEKFPLSNAIRAAYADSNDGTGPSISNISVGNVSTSSATITWTTDESADSQVEYGKTNSYGTVSPLDSNLVTTHTVTLSGLSSLTSYHFRVKSHDSYDNETVSADLNFKTGGTNTSGSSPSVGIKEIKIEQKPNNIPNTAIFNANLSIGMTHADVYALQKYLNAHGFPVAQLGVGSSGYETMYFGPATRNALIKFQTANSIKPAVGYFGPVTRALIAAKATPETTERKITTSTNLNVRTLPITGAIVAVMPKGATAMVIGTNGGNWLKVQLQDGTEGWISKLYVVLN